MTRRQRIAPIDPAYAGETRNLFDLVMPEAVEPLRLLRTLAPSGRIVPRLMRARVRGRGPVATRERELVICRATALRHSE